MNEYFDRVDIIRREVDLAVAMLLDRQVAVSVLKRAEATLRRMSDDPDVSIPRARLMEAADCVAEALAIVPDLGEPVSEVDSDVLTTAVGVLEDLRNA